MPKLTQEQWTELLRVVDYYICDETIRLIDENAGDVEELNFGQDPPYDHAFIVRQIVLPDGLPFGEFGDEVPHMEEEEKTNE